MDESDPSYMWRSGGAVRDLVDPAPERLRLPAISPTTASAPRARAVTLAPRARTTIPAEKELLLQIER